MFMYMTPTVTYNSIDLLHGKFVDGRMLHFLITQSGLLVFVISKLFCVNIARKIKLLKYCTGRNLDLSAHSVI